MARSEATRNHVFLTIPTYRLLVADVFGNTVDDVLREIVFGHRADAAPALFFSQPFRKNARRQSAQRSRYSYCALHLRGIEVGLGGWGNRVGAITDEERALSAGRSSKIARLESHAIEQHVITRNQRQGFLADVCILFVENAQNIFCDEKLWAALRDQSKELPKQIVASVGNAAMANDAESLARRPADKAVEFSCFDSGVVQQFVTVEFANIGGKMSDLW